MGNQFENKKNVPKVESGGSLENDKEEMANVIIPFIKNRIMQGDGLPNLASYEDHGHLDYEDDKFLSHYFHATPEGIMVAMYRKGKEGGLDDSTRQDILVTLNEEEKKVLVQKLRNFIDEVDWDKESNGDMREMGGLEEVIRKLSN